MILEYITAKNKDIDPDYEDVINEKQINLWEFMETAIKLSLKEFRESITKNIKEDSF
jgi:hypothetical protein